MRILLRLALVSLVALTLLSASAGTSGAQIPGCEPDGVQASGSIYRICMPATGYNGMLVVWAHGFQDAGTPGLDPRGPALRQRLLPAGDRQRPRLRVRDQQLQQDGARDPAGQGRHPRSGQDLHRRARQAAEGLSRRRVGGRPDHRAQHRAASRGVLGRSRRLRPDRRLPVPDQLLRRRARDVQLLLPRRDPGRPVRPAGLGDGELAELLRDERRSRSCSTRRTVTSSISGWRSRTCRTTRTTTSTPSRSRCRTRCATASSTSRTRRRRSAASRSTTRCAGTRAPTTTSC